MHAEKCAPGLMLFTFFLFFGGRLKYQSVIVVQKRKERPLGPPWMWSPGPPGVLARDGPECSRASICSAPLSKWDSFKWS